MKALVTSFKLDEMLNDGREIAVVDVREHGEYGSQHLLFCTSIPYSRFDFDLPKLVPNPHVRLVLYDADDGLTVQRAAAVASKLGYRNVARLQGGIQAWVESGYGTFKGVHVPSKTFGELVEHAYDTPSITAEDLVARQRRGDPVVVLDGRSWEEYLKMNIPGGISCPNGELAYRAGELAPDPNVPIVVNCAGRTRSIIGCETLRQFGVKNPVYALQNGTMGWRLAGLELEHDSQRRSDAEELPADVSERRKQALRLADRAGVKRESANTVRAWLDDDSRTTFLLDVRDPREYRVAHLESAVSAPGGQLIQATETFVGVHKAHLVLVDDTEVRAAVCAFWLTQMGYDAAFLEGGTAAWWATVHGSAGPPSADGPGAPLISVASLVAEMAAAQPPLLLDCRQSMSYREEHVPGAKWVIRPSLERVINGYDFGDPIRLIGDDHRNASILVQDLKQLGFSNIAMLDGGMAAWCAADQPVVATPECPSDKECVDYLFFVHDRHAGNLEAAKQYIAWEQGLVQALAPSEREQFTLVSPEYESEP